MFKSARPKRLITIIFWLILIFIAIVKLPSMTHLVTSVNNGINEPSQISRSASLINAAHLQNHWGRKLGHTTTSDIVYNRRNGQITSRQQRDIDHHVSLLQHHITEYGIQKITDLNTNRNGSDELKSHDNSTEIVQLSVDPHYQGANANIWADEINAQTHVKGLRSSITSPQLLKASSIRSTIHITAIVMIIGLLLSSLALGFLFKSLVAPIISLVSLLITNLIALSLSANLAHWTGFNELTPLAITITVLIAGTITTYFIYQAISMELPRHRDANNAVQQGISHVKQPIELSGLILTIAFGAAALIPETNVRPLVSLGITSAILTLAELTIIPTFASWLGHDLLWPSHHYELLNGHMLWNRLTRLSLWQPMIGIIAVIYFIVPFAYSYRNNVEYSQVNNLPTNNQAYKGSNELNAHFTAGKSTPVTIYLRSPQKFNRESTLKPVDDLTNKLQSMPGVNAVYSITQPSGMPINKYYVNHQLNAINNVLNQNQNQLYKASRKLKTGHKKLGKHQLGKIRKRLNNLSTVSDNVPKINLDNQLKQLQPGKQTSVTNKITTYRNQLQSLNGKLNQLSTRLNGISSINDNVKNYQHQIKSVNREMTVAIKQIKRVNNQLNDVYSYLSGLQRSSASHQYFITPDQIQDTDFQQSLINFTSQNERITKLHVVFNQAPSTRYNQARLHHLKHEAQTVIQGTPLSHAQMAFSGIPVQQATIQNHFRSGMLKALPIILGLILLSLMLISRSVLNPVFWLLSFLISSLAGAQITELITRYTTSQPQFNWLPTLMTMGVLIILATLELIPLSLAYRHRNVNLTEWLHETFTSFGQNVTAILIIVTITTLALFFGMTTQTAQISLVIIITAVIFNWVLPLVSSAFGKYLQTLPHSKL